MDSGLLIYLSRGPVAPSPDDPAPSGALRSVGHVLHGERAPFNRYEVFVDTDGMIWAKLHRSTDQRLDALTAISTD